jgi:hypothetical protein
MPGSAAKVENTGLWLSPDVLLDVIQVRALGMNGTSGVGFRPRPELGGDETFMRRAQTD